MMSSKSLSFEFLVVYVIALLTTSSIANGQDVISTTEKFRLDSPEGWAMAHTLSASLNLGSTPLTDVQPWRLSFSAELGSIPHLSREEQRVGFGGFKSEDMNKSPVFGRGRLHLGLPREFELELSWTPPVEINGGKPDGVYGLAIERTIFSSSNWAVGWRLFALRGSAQGDITCSEDVASSPPGSPGNPFGCREPSDDTIKLDHEGMEFSVSRTSRSERWQPYLGYAHTRIHPHVDVRARVFESLDRSQLEMNDTVQTLTMGLMFRPSQNWTWHTAFSYTPLDIRRPPDYSREDQNFWSFRLGLRWSPGFLMQYF